jgi:RNA 3'-terminal phosphate cyclase
MSSLNTKHVPLRIQLILSILSGKPIKLKNIRSDSDEPGLAGKPKLKNY